jgi:hypothetical protein
MEYAEMGHNSYLLLLHLALQPWVSLGLLDSQFFFFGRLLGF